MINHFGSCTPSICNPFCCGRELVQCQWYCGSMREVGDDAFSFLNLQNHWLKRSPFKTVSIAFLNVDPSPRLFPETWVLPGRISFDPAWSLQIPKIKIQYHNRQRCLNCPKFDSSSLSVSSFRNSFINFRAEISIEWNVDGTTPKTYCCTRPYHKTDLQRQNRWV